MNTNFEHVKSYAAEYPNWKMFPVWWAETGRCGCRAGENCTSAGKHPLVIRNLFEHGVLDATNDLAKLEAAWALHPRANIGLATGAVSGIYVLDPDDTDGLENLMMLQQANSILPPTLTSLTGGGGMHHIFQCPSGHWPNTTSGLAQNIDTRGDGGYIILPPSTHKSGRAYSWKPFCGPTRVEIAPLPPWVQSLAQSLLKNKTETSTPLPTAGFSSSTPPPDFASDGSKWLAQALARAVPGTRNATGFWLAVQLRDDGMQYSDALNVMRKYAAGVAQPSGNSYSAREAETSCREAFSKPPRAPARNPNGARAQQVVTDEAYTMTAVDDPQYFSDWDDAPDAAGPELFPDGIELTEEPAKAKRPPVPTDDEIAILWVNAHPNTAYGLGEFRRYENGYWPVVATETIEYEVLDILVAKKFFGIRPTAGRLQSVLKLAQVFSAVPTERWDAETDYLVCANGTLHLPTRRLEAWRADLYATSAVPYGYSPDAAAGAFDYALNYSIQGAAAFLQEFAGYALTTDTRHEIAVWFYGPPGCGKSTLLAGLEAMLGDRVCSLGLRDIERSRFALTNLPGKTLAVATEQPSGLFNATDILNRIISGEYLEVDRKFLPPVRVLPRAKLAWAMNELPRVADPNNGLFRRVKVIEFPPIAEKDRDPDLKERIKLEGAGILNWALDGLDRLKARGRFSVPECVTDATLNYRNSNDIPAAFLAERCCTGAAFESSSSLLYKAYSAWCLDTGHKPQSSTSLAGEWRRLGFTSKRMARGVVWEGIGLLEV